jgi:two-component system sensor histidine kinase AlgZ
MVALLGDFLRQTLERSNDQFVSLAQEIAFLRCYLDIEKTRFDDRLSVNFKIGDKILEAEVPHLIMQPLVENAVKHGIAPFEKPGIIEVNVNRDRDTLRLVVKNSIGGEPVPVSGNNGFGLANVGSRLFSIYGDAAVLRTNDTIEGEFTAELILPYRSIGDNGTGHMKGDE